MSMTNIRERERERKRERLTFSRGEGRHVINSLPFVNRVGNTKVKVKIVTSEETVFEVMSFNHAEVLDGLVSHLEDETVREGEIERERKREREREGGGGEGTSENKTHKHGGGE